MKEHSPFADAARNTAILFLAFLLAFAVPAGAVTSFVCPESSVLVMQEITLTAGDDEADRIVVRSFGEDGEFVWYEEAEETSVEMPLFWWNEGAYTVQAFGYHGRRPVLIGETVINVTATGSLPGPENLTLSNPVHFKGEPLQVSFDRVDDAESYYVTLNRDGEPFNYPAGQSVGQEDGKDTYTVEFGGGLFDGEGVYSVGVFAQAVGKNSGSSEMRFLVTDRGSVSDDIVLRVNGTGTPDAVESGEDVSITIDAPGASLVRLLWGSELQYYRPDENGHAEETRGFGKGRYNLTAQAYYGGDARPEDEDWDYWDGLNWERTGNGVPLTVVSPHGLLPAPSFTAGPSELTRGDFLGVEIEDPEFENKPEDIRYWAEAVDPETGRQAGDSQFLGGARENSFSTAALRPGRYRLRLHAEARGWDSSEALSEPFEVTATEGDGRLCRDRETARAGELFRFTAFADEADWIEFIFQNENGHEDSHGRGGSAVNIGYVWERAGDYRVRALAHYGRRSVPIGEVTVWVTAEGSLGDPEILRLGNAVQPLNGTQTVTFRNVHPDSYFVELFLTHEDRDWEQVYEADLGREDFGEEWDEDTLTVGLGGFRFQDPGQYEVRVQARRTGWNAGSSHVRFRAAETDSRITLWAYDANDQLIADGGGFTAREDVFFRIRAEGAKAVCLRWDDDDMRAAPCDGEGAAEIREGFGAGPYAFYAMACYEEIDTDEDGWEWKADWQGVSAGLSLYARADSVLEKPGFTMPDSIQQGKELSLTIQNNDSHEGEWYWADVHAIRREDGSEREEWVRHFDWDPDDREIHIQTCIRDEDYCLEPGEYLLRVRRAAPGCTDAEAETRFTVTDPEIPGGTFLFKVEGRQSGTVEDIYTGGDVELELYAANAYRVEIDIKKEGDLNWEDYRGTENASSLDSENNHWGADSAGLYTLTPYAWYVNGDGVDVRRRGGPVMVRVSANGGLEAPDIRIDAMPHTGEDLSGSFSAIAGAEYANVELTYLGDGSKWEQIPIGSGEEPRIEYPEYNPAPEGWTGFEIDGACFGRPGIYRVGVYANAAGKNSVHVGKRFIVTDAGAQQTVTLTINGEENEYMRFPAEQDLNIVIQTEGATAIRFFDDDWQYWFADEIKGGRVEFRRSFPAELFTLSAQACFENYDRDAENFDPNELNWSAVSNAISLRGTAEGALQMPEAVLSSAEVVRGEAVTVTITNRPQDTDVWYWAEVLRYTGDRWEDEAHFDWDRENQIRIPTAALEPGEYRLRVGVAAKGMYGNENEGRLGFTVLEAEEEITRDFFAGPRTVRTHEGVRFSAWAKDADRIEIVFFDEDGGRRDDRGGGGDTLECGYGWDSAGSWDVAAYAYYGAKAEEIGSTTIKVTADGGTLADPEILSLANTVQPLNGEQTVTFRNVENAGWYYIELWRTGDWERLEEYEREAEAGGEMSVTFPAEDFREAGEYEIRINANAVGFGSGHSHTRFRAMETPENPGHAVTLAVNGEDAAAAVRSNEEVRFEVNAPGARVVRIAWQDEREDFTEDPEHVIWRRSFNSGLYTIVAMACYDADLNDENLDWENLSWEGVSNGVQLRVTADGRADPAAFTVSPESREVTKGDYLTIAVTPREGEWYWADIVGFEENEEGRTEERWLGHTDWNRYSGTISVPTGALAPGNYRAYVCAGAEGLDNSEVPFDFTVENRAGEPDMLFSADRSEVKTHERVTFSAWAEYADGIELVFFGEDGDERDRRDRGGESIQEGYGWGEAGEYEVAAYAHFGRTAEEIGRITVTVTTDGEDLAVPEILSLSNRLQPLGEAQTVTFRTVEGAQWYYLQLFRIGEWEPVEDVDLDASEADKMSYTFGAGCFEQAGQYEVRVNANAFGRNSAGAWQRFMAAQADPERTVTLTVDGKTDSAAAVSSAGVPIVIDAPGAKAIRLIWADGDEIFTDPSGHVETQRGFGSGTHNLVAQACYDEIDFSGENWPDGVSWTGASNVVVLTVTSPNGKLDEPEFVMEPEDGKVARGEFLTIRLTRTQNRNEWYWANVLIPMSDGEGHTWEDWRDPDSWDGQDAIRIPTFGLAPIEYVLHVGTDAEGWEGNDKFVSFEVTEPENEETFSLTVSPESCEAVPYQEVSFYFYAKDADELKLQITKENDPDWEPVVLRKRGDYATMTWRFNRAGTYVAKPAAVFGNGEETYDEITITVNPKGALAAPEIRLSSVLVQLGDELTGTYEAVEGAEGYYVELERLKENGEWEYAGSNDGGPSGAFSFAAPERGIYRLSVYAGAYGYERSVSTETVAVLDLNRRLTLPSGLTEIRENAFANIPAELLVFTGRARTVAIQGNPFAGSGILAAVVPSGVTLDCGEDVTGSLVITDSVPD